MGDRLLGIDFACFVVSLLCRCSMHSICQLDVTKILMHTLLRVFPLLLALGSDGIVNGRSKLGNCRPGVFRLEDGSTGNEDVRSCRSARIHD
jgi:hypothetical protein